MNVALIGATGNVGQIILQELLSRGHRVTAISRSIDIQARENLTVKKADITDPDTLAPLLAGHDAVISVVWLHPGSSAGLIAAVKQSGVRRFIAVGGAGTLYVGPGKLFVEELEPQIPEEVRPVIREGLEYLRMLRRETDLDWTFICPPVEIIPGDSTGTFRMGTDSVLKDASGRSWITFGDFAVALVDTLERGTDIRVQSTVAY